MARSFAFPKPQYWQEFEDLTHELFKYAFGDLTPTKHGRSGQKQYGVDVFGRHPGTRRLIAIQCKRREVEGDPGKFEIGNPLTHQDVEDEVAKVDLKKLKVEQFIVATTANADGAIQRWAETYNEERWALDPGAFRVSVWYWQDYESYLNSNVELQKWYFKEVIDHFGRERSDHHVLSVLREALSRAAFRDPLHRENPRNFGQAIEHSFRAVDTGELIDRQTGLVIRKALGGVKILTSKVAKRNAPRLIKALGNLKEMYLAGLNELVEGHPDPNFRRLQDYGGSLEIYDDELRNKLNTIRREALILTNDILIEAGLETIDSPLLG